MASASTAYVDDDPGPESAFVPGVLIEVLSDAALAAKYEAIP